MDIGDLIFLILLGLGFLSSLGGARKKKGQAKRRPQTGQAAGQLSGPRAAGATKPRRKSRLAEARERAMSQMEELLRELEGEPAKPPPKPELPPRPSVELEVESQDLALSPPTPLERELPPPAPPVRDGTLHKAFHEKYIRPVSATKVAAGRPRVLKHLSSRKLREAVLLREILGPPKSLR